MMLKRAVKTIFYLSNTTNRQFITAVLRKKYFLPRKFFVSRFGNQYHMFPLC